VVDLAGAVTAGEVVLEVVEVALAVAEVDLEAAGADLETAEADLEVVMTGLTLNEELPNMERISPQWMN
jgi:hypothetical protein